VVRPSGVGRLLIVAENSFQLSVLLPMAETHPARQLSQEVKIFTV